MYNARSYIANAPRPEAVFNTNKSACFVLTRDRIWWSRSCQDHEDIIREFRLNQDGVRGPNIARVQLIPPSGRLTDPAAEWSFWWDQDRLPAWFDPPEVERQTRAELPAWLDAKVLVTGTRDLHDKERLHVFGTAHANLCDLAQADLHDSASACLHDSSSACLRGSSSARAHDSASAWLFESTKAELYNRARAEVYGPASAELFNHASAELRGSASVVAHDKSVVTRYSPQASCRLVGRHAIEIDRTDPGGAACRAGPNPLPIVQSPPEPRQCVPDGRSDPEHPLGPADAS